MAARTEQADKIGVIRALATVYWWEDDFPVEESREFKTVDAAKRWVHGFDISGLDGPGAWVEEGDYKKDTFLDPEYGWVVDATWVPRTRSDWTPGTKTWDKPSPALMTFGFMVQRKRGRWLVQLPHQCDYWEITDGMSGDRHEDAVAALEAFIAEAQLALGALKEQREFEAL